MNERSVALFASLSCHAVLLVWAALVQANASPALPRHASPARNPSPAAQDARRSAAPSAAAATASQAPQGDERKLTPEELFDQLLPQLETWPAQAARKGVDQLSQLGANAAPLVRRTLANGSAKVRSASAQVLGSVGTAADVSELMQALLDRHNRADARTVIAAMHKLDAPRTKMLLIGLLVQSDAGLRKAAYDGLVREVNRDDVPALCEQLTHKEGDVREKVFDLLKQAGDRELPRRSLALVGDPAPGVARRVLDLLAIDADPTITSELVARSTSESDRVMSHALLILAAKEDLGQGELLTTDRLPSLQSDLKSNDPLVRVASCVAWLAIDYRQELPAEQSQVSPTVAIPALFELFTSQRYFRDHPAAFASASRMLYRVLGVDLGDSIPAWKSWWDREGHALQVLSEMSRIDPADLNAVEIAWQQRAESTPTEPMVFAGDATFAEPRLQTPGDLDHPPMVLAPAEMAALVEALGQCGVFAGHIAREHPEATTHVEIKVRGSRRRLAFKLDPGSPGARIDQTLRTWLERERWQLYPPANTAFAAWWRREYAWWHAADRKPEEREQKLVDQIGACVATLTGERALRALADLESLVPVVTKSTAVVRPILILIGVQEHVNDVAAKAVDLICATHDPLLFTPLCDVLTTTFGEAAEPLIGKSMVALNQVASALSHPLPMVRRLAIERAAEEGENVVPILIDALTDLDHNVRLAAIEALGRVGSKQAFENLKIIATSGQGADRAAAIKALGGIGGDDALVLLQDALRGDDAAVKLAALAGMAELATPEAVDALMIELHLENVSNDLRAAALAGLRRIGGESVRAKVRSLLQSDKQALKADAAILLGHLLDNEATPILITLLDKADRHVEARGALAKLFVADLGDDPFAYEVLAKEGRPFEELFLRATGLSGSLAPGELRGAGCKRSVVIPALIDGLTDARWVVREDADVLLKELLQVHLDPLLKEATQVELVARQRLYRKRAGP